MPDILPWCSQKPHIWACVYVYTQKLINVMWFANAEELTSQCLLLNDEQPPNAEAWSNKHLFSHKSTNWLGVCVLTRTSSAWNWTSALPVMSWRAVNGAPTTWDVKNPTCCSPWRPDLAIWLLTSRYDIIPFLLFLRHITAVSHVSKHIHILKTIRAIWNVGQIEANLRIHQGHLRSQWH